MTIFQTDLHTLLVGGGYGDGHFYFTYKAKK